MGRVGLADAADSVVALSDGKPEKLYHVGRVPFSRPYDAANFLSAAIDDERCRQADCADFPQHLTRRVNVRRKVMDGDVGIEFADGIEAAQVDGDRNDFEIEAAQGS